MAAPKPRSLTALKRAEDACRRCPLYKKAVQAVPGEGAAHASLMLVGEQPGNEEDLKGHPFVGPAGKLLDRALEDAGIARQDTFVTNAVKHFKFVARGKRRLHQRPNAYEIERCKWWNDIERALVKPKLVVALGATAAKSLHGKALTISKVRGKILEMKDGKLLVTMHPSALLRIPSAADRKRQYRAFVADLASAKAFLRTSRAASEAR